MWAYLRTFSRGALFYTYFHHLIHQVFFDTPLVVPYYHGQYCWIDLLFAYLWQIIRNIYQAQELLLCFFLLHYKFNLIILHHFYLITNLLGIYQSLILFTFAIYIIDKSPFDHYFHLQILQVICQHLYFLWINV
jgi:hypothetical protein